MFPIIFLHVSDVKFDVDYDSAIKHDLILFFDQVMGMYSFALKGEIALTPQNHLHTLIHLPEVKNILILQMKGL